MKEIIENIEQKPSRGAPKANKNAETHGHYPRKAALIQLGFAGIDKRTTAGRELAQRREQIFIDAGGQESLSQLKQDLIEKYLRTVILIESIDAWLFQQPSILNRKKKMLYPIVRERAQLVDSALRLAQAVGLDRQTKPIDITAGLAEAVKESQS